MCLYMLAYLHGYIYRYITYNYMYICVGVNMCACVSTKHSRITFNNHKPSRISPHQPLSRPYSLRHGCSFRAHLCQTLVQHLRESSMISLREIFHPAYQWKGQFPIHNSFPEFWWCFAWGNWMQFTLPLISLISLAYSCMKSHPAFASPTLRISARRASKSGEATAMRMSWRICRESSTSQRTK